MAVIDLEPRPPAIDVRKLSASYGAAPVLDGVSLRLHAGELLAVLGGNGAGNRRC